jgi:protein-tyrosine phosphatase
VLTEFSYFQQPNFVNEVAFNLRTIDVVPILAHPERYRYLNNSKQYNELKNAGFHFQLNLLSLAGNYGRTAQERGFKLLETNQFDFVGTDAHNESHLESIQKYTIPKKYKSAFIQVVNKHKELINVN